jgi:hypothetical protein
MYKIYAVNHETHGVYYRTSYDDYIAAVWEAILSSEQNNVCSFEIWDTSALIITYNRGNIVHRSE